jgi:hypothetical protein
MLKEFCLLSYIQRSSHRYRGDLLLEPSDRIGVTKEGERHVLTVSKVLKTEEGVVNVRATNEVGQMSASARLKVAGTTSTTLFRKYAWKIDQLHCDSVEPESRSIACFAAVNRLFARQKSLFACPLRLKTVAAGRTANTKRTQTRAFDVREHVLLL